MRYLYLIVLTGMFLLGTSGCQAGPVPALAASTKAEGLDQVANLRRDVQLLNLINGLELSVEQMQFILDRAREAEAIREEIKGRAEGNAAATSQVLGKLQQILLHGEVISSELRGEFFSVEGENSGSAPVDDVILSAEAPEDWEIEFTPSTIDSITADGGQAVEVNIRPAARAIAGDYYISLRAEGSQTSAERIDIRVSVRTPTVWGWVGVIIILAAIAGVIYIFMRFSRR